MTDFGNCTSAGAFPDQTAAIDGKARELLCRFQKLSVEIDSISSSLQPIIILLEACCSVEGSSEHAGSDDVCKRSELEKRWIGIFEKQGLLTPGRQGKLQISAEGARKLDLLIGL